jgi:hypothetical protein
LPLPTPELDVLRQSLQQAKRTESKARELMGKAKAAAEATVVVVAERQNVEQVITHYTSVEAELAAACESLKKRVRSVIDVSEERNVEEQV